MKTKPSRDLNLAEAARLLGISRARASALGARECEQRLLERGITGKKVVPRKRRGSGKEPGLVLFRGKLVTRAFVAEALGITLSAVYLRIKRGKPLDRPKRQRGGN